MTPKQFSKTMQPGDTHLPHHVFSMTLAATAGDGVSGGTNECRDPKEYAENLRRLFANNPRMKFTDNFGI